MEKQEIDIYQILDFIGGAIHKLEASQGKPIVVCMPRLLITYVERHNHTSWGAITGPFDAEESRIFGKPIQPNYNNSVVVFVDDLYITNDAKLTLEL